MSADDDLPPVKDTMKPAFEGELQLIVVADLHFVGEAEHHGDTGDRRVELGLELIERIVRRARAEGNVDAILVMGDLVDNGNMPRSEKDLAALHDVLDAAGIISVIVPGNHDGPPEWLLDHMNDAPGPHTIKGYVLYSFADHVFLEDKCFRNARDLDALIKFVTEHPEQPVIALQHNPIYPHINDEYPYNIANPLDVIASYRRAAIVTSVSGHYHPGIPLTYSGGVGYVTCPALCEDPFPYLRLRVNGGEVISTRPKLKMDCPVTLSDVHVHTEFAFCGSGITAKTAIERAKQFGVDRISLTEHADQLYMDYDTWRMSEVISDPDLHHRMRDEKLDRYAEYRKAVEPLRSSSVRLGLEVECNSRFEPILLQEDRQGWDILLGGVHWMSTDMIQECGSRDKTFMRLLDALIDSGVDILAHPFRYFHANGLPVPRQLFRTIAQLLADEGVAAEVNFHNNVPDDTFIRCCLEENVRIALGSDSHAFHEVGELQLHLDFLRRIGVSDELLPAIIYQL